MSTEAVIDQPVAAGAQARQFATFYVDGLLFGVDVLHVQEVLRYQEMTQVPLALAVIQGLINLRGQIVTAIDVRKRLGLLPREGREPMNMVVRSDEGAVSLLVDEIGDVIEVADRDFEEKPDNVAGVVRDLTTGIYKLQDRLLLVLDTRKVLQLAGSEDEPESQI
jgi:purine-binding chemotaxis protein CheW